MMPLCAFWSPAVGSRRSGFPHFFHDFLYRISPVVFRRQRHIGATVGVRGHVVVSSLTTGISQFHIRFHVPRIERQALLRGAVDNVPVLLSSCSPQLISTCAASDESQRGSPSGVVILAILGLAQSLPIAEFSGRCLDKLAKPLERDVEIASSYLLGQKDGPMRFYSSDFTAFRGVEVKPEETTAMRTGRVAWWARRLQTHLVPTQPAAIRTSFGCSR